MPYIVSTSLHEDIPARPGMALKTPTGSQAVATLEEARESAYQEVVAQVNDTTHEGTPGDGLKDACCDLTESGGTIGPLPNGCVIDVRETDYDELANIAGEWIDPEGDLTASEEARIIDAYNAGRK